MDFSNWVEDKRKFVIATLLGVSALCLLWVIVGTGGVDPTKESVATIEVAANETIDFSHHHAGETKPSKGKALKIKAYVPCAKNFTDYTPCEDPTRANRFSHKDLFFHERHCPEPAEELKCLVPPPTGYKNPIAWPQSRDEIWYVNVPYKHLTVAKAVQNWVEYNKEEEKFVFPGGGTMFPNGADAYLDALAKLIPLEGGSIRTAVDTGCGVASFGGFLLSRGVLTMSFAPRDNHEAQVQFALERGIPAMVWTLATRRLPFPARSFDLAHCSRCLIPWASHKNGLYLTELDRVLRPGGYWVLSGPPINWQQYWKGWARTEADLKEEQDGIEDMVARLCWTKVVQKGDFAVFQKPLNNTCISKRKKSVTPKLCKEDSDPDFAWYADLEPCQTRVPDPVEDAEDNVAGGKLADWPARLTKVPPRVAAGLEKDITMKNFGEDKKLWASIVAGYKDRLLPPLSKGQYRNIMDMNAGFGSFAAALAKDNVWVMNVVPPAQTTKLGVIYERGLIGAYHDWCEAFSTYPRTYDFIHAAGVFSLITQKNCSAEKLLMEMDRILRPEGAAIIRDEVDQLTNIKNILRGMRWVCRMADHEDGPKITQKIFICIKKYWTL